MVCHVLVGCFLADEQVAPLRWCGFVFDPLSLLFSVFGHPHMLVVVCWFDTLHRCDIEHSCWLDTCFNLNTVEVAVHTHCVLYTATVGVQPEVSRLHFGEAHLDFLAGFSRVLGTSIGFSFPIHSEFQTINEVEHIHLGCVFCCLLLV